MTISQIITRRRHTPVVRRLVHWAWRVIDAADNSGNIDMVSNGEFAMLAALGKSHPNCIFDVGCNHGDWAAAVAEHCPTAAIHCFEAVPKTATICGERFAATPRIVVNAAGLSDTVGTRELRVWAHDDRLSSAIFEEHAGESSIVACRMLRGDDYCAEHDIAAIDLLKIDVEGAEPAVLRGFQGMLERGAVKSIQFEYGRANLVSRFFLSDYYALLGRNFHIGRIFPDGIEFKDYDSADERFALANFLAVRRDQPELLGRLADEARTRSP